MVACGTVDELRASGPEQAVVEVCGADPSWARALPGVTVVEEGRGRLVVQLDDQVDDQRLLRAALAAGAVREFARRRPPLTELFRHVVSAPTDRDQAAASGTADGYGHEVAAPEAAR
jgi:ABC-2 type transport system ATP-binding protein